MLGGSRFTATLVASWLIASPALADPRDAKGASDKDKQVASELVKKAIARSQAGDHSAAIDIYLQAYTIVPNSLLLSNIGSEYQQSGKQKEALRYFCMYLEKEPNGTNAVYATTQARSLQALLGNKHVEDDDVCAPAKPEAKAKDPSDKRRKPRDPDEPEAEPREVKPREAASGERPAAGDDRARRYVGYAMGGAGVIGLVVGGVAGLKAKSISDEITNHPRGTAWDNGIRALEQRGQNYEYLQIGGLIAGGALVITGVILYVQSRGSPDAAHDADKTAVHVTPTTNGVAVFGRF